MLNEVNQPCFSFLKELRKLGEICLLKGFCSPVSRLIQVHRQIDPTNLILKSNFSHRIKGFFCFLNTNFSHFWKGETAAAVRESFSFLTILRVFAY